MRRVSQKEPVVEHKPGKARAWKSWLWLIVWLVGVAILLSHGYWHDW